MAKQTRKPCPQCQRWQQRFGVLEAEIRTLRAEVGRLQEKLAAAQKNSSTSSKPPSSDLVKPPGPAAGEGSGPRSAGGQPGHLKHQREPFAPEQITHFG